MGSFPEQRLVMKPNIFRKKKSIETAKFDPVKSVAKVTFNCVVTKYSTNSGVFLSVHVPGSYVYRHFECRENPEDM